MFYSHEVLTSRKHGVATVWLVATLGAKSTLKKVSRKAILDVDVQKACETIVTPEAPMALRLQSNLLYGIARVYSQQCGYVLTDAEAAKNTMRTVLKVMRTNALEVEGGHKARAEQLVLEDDPNFLPELDLVPMDLDQLDTEVTTPANSGRSTLAPHDSQITIGSQQIGGLIIPGRSASSMIGGSVSGYGGFSSVRGDSAAGMRRDTGGLLDDDEVGITIMPDGSMQMSDPAIPTVGGEQNDPVRREEDPGLERDALVQMDDDGPLPMQDELAFLADAEHLSLRDTVGQQTTSTETAEAPLRPRARVAKKIIPADNAIELRNGDLARWNTEYVANMQEVLRHRDANRSAALAKQNAEYLILGPGLGLLGFSDQGPLSMFSGAKLLETLTSTAEKRAREDTNAETDRRVRPRGEPSSDEVGRGFQDDGYVPMVGDDTIEQGREAPTPLDERHLSSVFPWNQSTGSRRPTGIFTSASFGGSVINPIGSRRGSRLVSPSPLLGRGMISSHADIEMTGLGEDDFELFGPAAQVDTQTAAQSQWQRSALESEAVNFLAFVQAGIKQADQIRDAAAPGDEEDEAVRGSVAFDALLPPEANSRVVAAQALLHVLALGTKNMVHVEQDGAFEAIVLALS